MSNDLLFAKEIAAELRRSRTYVFAMRAWGFQMPGGTATLEEARQWLRDHPDFRTSRIYGNPESRLKKGSRVFEL